MGELTARAQYPEETQDRGASTIEGAQARLHEASGVLGDLLVQLAKRLQPVLSDRAEKEGIAPPTLRDVSGSSEHFRFLDDECSTLDGHIRKVRSILSDLEV